MKYYVYMTTNLINNKRYIGLTSKPIDSGYIGSGSLFLKAVAKYGKENFKRIDLYSNLTLELASSIERNLIKENDAMLSESFYNLKAGGKNVNEGPHHPNSISKISIKCKKAWNDKRDMYLNSFSTRDNSNIGRYDKSGKNNPMYNKFHTKETKEKISNMKKGVKMNLSDEQKEYRKQAAKNNPVMMGKKTDKQKAKNRWTALKKEFGKLPVISEDMKMMHDFYDMRKTVNEFSPELLRKFIHFRFKFLEEELTEGFAAIDDENPEEIVDSLIDLIVVASGTLDLFGVDFKKAWYEVLKANMSKEVGIKEGRKNELGLPDLKKPNDWIAPNHSNNHGLFEKAFNSKK